MARFFFDIDNGSARFTDEEGIDLPDVEAGRDEVLRTLGEIARDSLPKGDHQTIRAFMCDASGKVAYSAAVTVSGAWHADRS